MRVLRWLVIGLAAAVAGAFLLALLAPRRRIPATPVPVYVAPPPADDEQVSVEDAEPLPTPSDD